MSPSVSLGSRPWLHCQNLLAW